MLVTQYAQEMFLNTDQGHYGIELFCEHNCTFEEHANIAGVEQSPDSQN